MRTGIVPVVLVSLSLLLSNAICQGQTQVNPGVYPYSLVVKLLMTVDGSQYHGTGVILNETFVLTNAHNVYDKHSITIISGYSNTDIDEIARVSVRCERNTSIFYDDRFDQDDAFDFALIKYDNDDFYNRVMNSTSNGTFHLASSAQTQVDILHIAGYPFFRFFEVGKPRSAKVQYTNQTTQFNIEEDIISYRLNTRKGSSGSPLWTDYQGQLRIVGIHKSGRGKRDQGIYFSDEKINIIRQWMSVRE